MTKAKTITVNIHEAKTQFSKYLKKAEKGQTIIVCRRNVPIAEIRATSTSPAIDRKKWFGMDKGKVTIAPEFFDPMPDDFLAYFDGSK